jgi:hypothetical protein
MTKKELMQAAWIPVHLRLPPKSDEDVIFFNGLTKQVGTSLAHVLRVQLQQIMEGTKTLESILRDPHGNGRILAVMKSSGYFATHWMKKVGPKEGRTCSICLHPQWESPSGWVCKNGHGDAPSIEEEL